MAFKKNIARRCSSRRLWLQTVGLPATCFATLFVGCSLLRPLPPIDLQEPGWSVKQGQAVWNVKRGGPEIAGELLLASDGHGRTFVQFTKGPFPMVTAQITPNGWQIERPAENKRYSGPGKPPARFILLRLPRLLTGEPPPSGWTWVPKENHGWLLENKKTGESLEGYLE